MTHIRYGEDGERERERGGGKEREELGDQRPVFKEEDRRKHRDRETERQREREREREVSQRREYKKLPLIVPQRQTGFDRHFITSVSRFTLVPRTGSKNRAPKDGYTTEETRV